MSGRCKDCRHWQVEIRKDKRLTDKPMEWDEQAGRWVFGYEEYEYEDVQNAGWRVCKYANDGALMRIVAREDDALETAPDFGCTAFAPKEGGMNVVDGQCRLCYQNGPIETDDRTIYRCPDHDACAARAAIIAPGRELLPPDGLAPEDYERLRRRLADEWVKRTFGGRT